MNRWLDIKGLAELLNVPIGWVEKAVEGRSIPITWVGKHARFTPADIDAIEAMGKEHPAGTAAPQPLRLVTGPRPPAGPPVPRPPAGPATPSKGRSRAS